MRQAIRSEKRTYYVLRTILSVRAKNGTGSGWSGTTKRIDQASQETEAAGVALRNEDRAGPYHAIPYPGADRHPAGTPRLLPPCLPACRPASQAQEGVPAGTAGDRASGSCRGSATRGGRSAGGYGAMVSGLTRADPHGIEPASAITWRNSCRPSTSTISLLDSLTLCIEHVQDVGLFIAADMMCKEGAESWRPAPVWK